MTRTRKPGRPREMVAPQTLTVTLEQVQIDRLVALSKESGKSISQLVREILARQTEEEKASEPAP